MKPFPKRLPDWEAFDRLEFSVAPRFKTSGLSGDTWRTSVVVKPFFKGIQVNDEEGRPKEFHFRDMQTALMMFGAQWMHEHEPIPEHVIDLEKKYCFQPGCRQLASHRVNLKREFSAQGDMIDERETAELPPRFRLFCADHHGRGDASREDCDKNYATAEEDQAAE